MKLSEKKNKHLRIYEQLVEGILQGHYESGKRLPSDADLAKQYGVSRPTVAKAVLELEKKGMVERRGGAGTFVRNSRVGKTSKLGLLMTRLQLTPPDYGDFVSLYSTVVSQMAVAASDSGYVLLMNELPFGDENELVSRAWEICRQLIDMQVKGVFFMPLEVSGENAAINRRIAEAFDAAGIAVTLLDRDIDAPPSRSRFDIVGVNNEQGMFELTSHLIRKGCRRINFASGKVTVSSVFDRIGGYEKALRHHGITPEASRIRRFEILPFTERQAEAERTAVRHLLENMDADALICVNDRTAALVIKYAPEFGIRIPDDVKVAGFDDEAFCAYLPTPLTTMRQPSRIIGAEAVRTMLSRIQAPGMPARNVLVMPELVVRQSCGNHTTA